jgi:CIC family chloride channel protein
VNAPGAAEALATDHKVASTVADLAELPPLVTPDSTLSDALSALTSMLGTGLPVLVPGNQLIGWITHQPILNSLNLTKRTMEP